MSADKVADSFHSSCAIGIHIHVIDLLSQTTSCLWIYLITHSSGSGKFWYPDLSIRQFTVMLKCEIPFIVKEDCKTFCPFSYYQVESYF